MVVKGQSGLQKKPASATSEQVRLAQLTLEGKSTEDDTSTIQKLIKKVIETTRCSPSQAEIALYDNDNNLMAAVDYIFERGELDSWTEHKSKKDKKKEEEEKRVISSRSLPSSRGRGGSVADRGGRGGRGGSTALRTSVPRGGGIPGRGGRGGQSNVKPQFASRSQTETPQKPGESDLTEETSDWKNGPMEFKRSEAPAAVPSSSCESAQPSSSSVSTTNAPISFAAVAAAAARREQERAMAPPRPVTPPVQEPVRAYSPVKDTPFEEPETSEPLPTEDIYVPEPSVANPPAELEDEPVVEDELNVVSDHNVQAASPQLQANAVWTTQLKSELGIGVPLTTDASPVKPQQQQYSAPVPTAGVEFATDAVSAVLPDYSFGFVDVPVAPVVAPASPAPVVEQVPQQQESLFASVRHSAAAVSPLKPSTEITHTNLSNGDYSLRSTTPPPAVNPLSQTTARSLGFGDASTVSYTPTGGVERQMPGTKPLGHLSQPQQHQPQQSSQQQQQPHQPQMFPPQLPYSSFPPYMGMYSPVNTVRPDDYAAALMGQYPFGGMNTDLMNFMAGSGLAQSSNNQQPLSSQHRSDSHGMDSMKFPSQNSRDHSQSSTVQPPPPPPGFGAGASQFMSQPLNNLVMPQHYTPQHYSFYLPNVTNAGRQMYGQDEERKYGDKMGGANKAHATPPPQFHHSNTNYLGGNSKKSYNWNS